ncbi:hypothetical protein HWB99_gp066 [Mycobacterium phage DrLupo]|uniref:Uncharacterized protein n=1 Tax=Mycobacterium phage DrLupo TaxID=2499037 RepID=A0A3S9UQP3_9CAUD|nr:hypothetical protein HWB99_gp066 [Mycobacterium phage DrLupo]AZS12602.1 hypothetical protein SEA_DRLUPO_66 [Mycobacterium phage DrLupo]
MTPKQTAEKMYRDWRALYKKTPALVDQFKAWGPPEPLDAELKEHLYDSFLGIALKHPLVFGIPYFAQENPRYNACLKWKRECLEKYMSSRDFSQVIHAFERPYRIDAIGYVMEHCGDVTGIEMWTMLRVAWTDSENIWQNEQQWRDLFEEWYDDSREFFMTSESAQEWAMLPDDQPVPVYRGFSVDGREQGMSWTTDKIRAKWFARRFANDGHGRGAARLAIGTVMKCDCIGYVNERTESEVVVFPEKVDIVRIGEV